MRNPLTKRATGTKNSTACASVTVFAKLANNSIFRKTFTHALDACEYVDRIAKKRCIGCGILRREVQSIWATYNATHQLAINPIELC